MKEKPHLMFMGMKRNRLFNIYEDEKVSFI